MQLTVISGDGSDVLAEVGRYATDEHNNLCVYNDAGTLVRLYAARTWKSVTQEEGK